MSAYADTSVLISLYTLDANSAKASRLMERVQLPIYLTPFGELELTNALEWRFFRNEARSSKIKAAHAALREDIENGVFALSPLPSAVFEKARQISRRRTVRFGVRTLDILHVPSAVVLHAESFLSFDLRQVKLARAEGLRTT